MLLRQPAALLQVGEGARGDSPGVPAGLLGEHCSEHTRGRTEPQPAGCPAPPPHSQHPPPSTSHPPSLPGGGAVPTSLSPLPSAAPGGRTVLFHLFAFPKAEVSYQLPSRSSVPRNGSRSRCAGSCGGAGFRIPALLLLLVWLRFGAWFCTEDPALLRLGFAHLVSFGKF